MSDYSLKVREMYNLIVDILCAKKLIKKIEMISIVCPTKLILKKHDSNGAVLLKNEVGTHEINEFIRKQYMDLIYVLKAIVARYKEHMTKDSYDSDIVCLFENVEYLNEDELAKNGIFKRFYELIEVLNTNAEMEYEGYMNLVCELKEKVDALKAHANNGSFQMGDNGMFKLAYSNFKSMNSHLVSGMNNV